MGTTPRPAPDGAQRSHGAEAHACPGLPEPWRSSRLVWPQQRRVVCRRRPISPSAVIDMRTWRTLSPGPVVTSAAAHTKAGEASRGRQLVRRYQPGTARDRHQRAALGPDLELLARRQGQLRRRPGVRRRRSARSSPTSSRSPAPPAQFLPAPSATWPARRASASSWTSAPACPPPTTPTRSPSAIAPESRIVYVDNDPLVLVHARALLTSTPRGATAYIDADLRDPDTILQERRRDPGLRPAGRADADRHPGPLRRRRRGPQSIVRPADGRRCPPAATWCINDGTDTSEAGSSRPPDLQRARPIPYHLRSPEQIARFFDGLELVEPGVVSPVATRARASGPPAEIDSACGVARKPLTARG